MNVEFNLTKIQSLFTDFYNLCHLPLALLDTNYKAIFEYPPNRKAYCALIRENPEGNNLCIVSEQYGYAMAEKSDDDYVLYNCHAGVSHVCFAIKYEKQIVGYFFIGSFLLDETMNNIKPEDFLQMCSHLIPEEKRLALEAALHDLDTISTPQINSTIHIMQACINNMIYQNMFKIQGDYIWKKIADYVETNLNRQFSLSDMSNDLFVSVSTISHKTKDITGESIGNYILRRRMSQASDYLRNTDYPVKQVAELVGIIDYNYFSRLFKRNFGVSPSYFRKIHQSSFKK